MTMEVVDSTGLATALQYYYHRMPGTAVAVVDDRTERKNRCQIGRKEG